MALSDFTTEGERLIQAGRGEPADANAVICGMVICEKIVLPADADGGPIAEGVLLGFMDLVFGKGPNLPGFDPVLRDDAVGADGGM